MVHVPAAIPLTDVPETVHTDDVRELKVTGKPELAVAETVAVPSTTSVGAAPKVMVWLVPTVKLCVTCEAAM